MYFYMEIPFNMRTRPHLDPIGYQKPNVRMSYLCFLTCWSHGLPLKMLEDIAITVNHPPELR